MKTASAFLAGLAIVSCPLPGLAQQAVYPLHGQSVGRQAHDESQCSSWAVRQTGFDPRTPPPAQVAAAPVSGSGARVRGAAGGAIIGAVAGNAGAGALAGAATGGLVRRARNRSAADQANAFNAQHHEAGWAAYERARAACLTGRGYSVR